MTSQDFLTVAGWVAEGKCDMKCADGQWRNTHAISINGAFDEYRRRPEPREWWLSAPKVGTGLKYEVSFVKPFDRTLHGLEIIHVREVLEP